MTREQYEELSLMVKDLKYLLENTKIGDDLSWASRSELRIAMLKISDILGEV